MDNKIKLAALFISLLMFLTPSAQAEDQDQDVKVTETQDAVEITLPVVVTKANKPASAESTEIDPLRYTLGPDDVIEIMVLRHPEFSGKFPINLEGKIQYKFVGDILVTGLTKKELENKLKETLSTYIIDPEVNVTILEYKSKIIFVLGEVARPGKFYMRSDVIPVRDALVQAGLPTLAAAMRRCQLITPSETGEAEIKSVDVYSLLYGGNLKNNLLMQPGEVLYVPSTVMAKIIRVINPVASTVGLASSGPEDAAATKSSLQYLGGK